MRIPAVLILSSLLQGALSAPCYQETRDNRVFSANPGGYDVDAMTPDVCKAACLKLRLTYSALTAGKYCFCGDTLPGGGEVDEATYCTTTCTGSADKCGSDEYVSVHTTPIPFSGLSLAIDDADEIVDVFTDVSFTISHDSVSSAVTHLYNIDFGDGQGRHDLQQTQNVVHRYGLPGHYTATVYLMDQADELTELVYSRHIYVQSLVNTDSIQFSCPEVVATDSEFSCNATVLSGTFMQASITWCASGCTPESFNIADSMWFGAGHPFSELQAAAPVSITHNAGEVMVLPDAEFQYSGTLVAVEYHAATVGDIKLLVLSPACSANEYCSGSNDCIASASCTPLGADTCSGSEQYCGMRATCVPTASLDTCPTPAPSRYTGNLGLSYTVKHEVDVNLAATGYGSTMLDLSGDLYEVETGDVIAFYPVSTGRITYRPLGIGEDTDKKHTASSPAAGAAIDSSAYGSLTDGKFMLRALAARRSPALFYHTYTQSGAETVTVEVVNTLESGRSYTAATDQLDLPIQIGIDQVTIINTTPFYSVDTQLTFNLDDHTGAEVTYTWDFGDGSAPVPTSERSATHTYTTPGDYTITVTAVNLLSSKEGATNVTLQEALSRPTIVADSSPCVMMQDCVFDVTISQGSDFTCTWDFGDGSPVIGPEVFDTNTDFNAAEDKSHNYTVQETYTVTVACANEISTQTATLETDTVWPIEGLELMTTGTRVGTPFSINLRVQHGSDITWTVFLYAPGAPESDADVLTMTPHPTEEKVYVSNSLPGKNGGLYTLTVVAENPVDREEREYDFTIDSEIEDLQVTTDPEVLTAVEFGAVVTFSIYMTAGTSVVVTIDFGDGSDEYRYERGTLQSWTDANPPESEEDRYHRVQHTYDRMGGLLTAVVTVGNNFNTYPTTFQISVLRAIEGLVLNDPPPTAFEPEDGAVVRFSFTATQEIPVQAEVSFQYEDQEDAPWSNWEEFSMDGDYYHQYMTNGERRVNCKVRNPINEVALSAYVLIAYPILGMSLRVEPEHAVINEPSTILVGISQGDNVRVEVNYNVTSEDVWDATRDRTSTNPYVPEVFEYTYTARGTYAIKVKATNPIGPVEQTYLLQVLSTCDVPFRIIANPIQVWTPTEADGGHRVTFNLELPGDEVVPEDAYLIWSYGDTNEDGSSTVEEFIGDTNDRIALEMDQRGDGVYQQEKTHVYRGPGVYQVNVTIFNAASTKSVQVEVAILELITNPRVEVRSQPHLPLNADPRPGLGVNNDQFPLQYDVAFLPSMDAGTVRDFRVHIIEPDDSISTCLHDYSDKLICADQFTEVGTYTVEIEFSNDAMDPNPRVSVTFEMIETAGSMTLYSSDSEVIRPGENKQFNITTQYFGVDACMEFDYGVLDDVEDLHMIDKEFYGTEEACVAQFGSAASHTEPLTPLITIDSEDMYHVEGVYTVTATIKDDANPDGLRSTYRLIVSSYDCVPPEITITNQATDFQNPQLIEKSKSIAAIGSARLHCGNHFDNVKAWKVFQVDENTGEDIEEVLLDQQTEDIPDKIHTTRTQLDIPPRYLHYGLYRFEFNVTMTWPYNDFQSLTSTFIRVKETPLVVRPIDKMTTSFSVSTNEVIRLNPADNSYDPDEESSGQVRRKKRRRKKRSVGDSLSGFDRFTIICYQVNEELVYNQDGSIRLIGFHIPKTEEETSAVDYVRGEQGGCTGEGPGELRMSAEANPLGEFLFHTSNLLVNETYVFLVQGHLGDRMGESMLMTTTVDGQPPTVSVNCGFGTNCIPTAFELNINPERVSVIAEYDPENTPTREESELRYKWELYREGLNGAWIRLYNIDQYITGVNAKELSISSTLFERDRDEFDSYYKYKVDVTACFVEQCPDPITNEGIEGFASMVLRINEPPSKGWCNMTALGKAVDNNEYYVECENWYDSNRILPDYELFAHVQGDTLPTLIQSGDLSNATVFLPVGKRTQGYNVTCWVMLYDTLRAATTVPLGTVQVQPRPATNLREEADAMADDTDLLKAIAEGDPKETSKVVIRNGDILNTVASDTTKEYAEDVEVIRDLPGGFEDEDEEPLDPSRRSGETAGNQTQEELKRKYEVQTDSRAQVREKLMDGIASLPKATVSDCQQATSAIVGVLSTPTEVTLDTQERATEAAAEITTSLKNQYERGDLTYGQLMPVAKEMLKALGNLNLGVSTASQLPTLTDKKRVQKTEDWFYNTDYNVENSDDPRQVAEFDDMTFDESLQAFNEDRTRLHQTNKAVGLATASTTATDDIIEMIAEMMIAAEDFNVETPHMVVSLNKNRGADLIRDNVDVHGTQVEFANAYEMGLDPTESYASQIQVQPFNNRVGGPTGSKVSSQSHTLTIEIKESDGKKKKLKNMLRAVKLKLKRNARKLKRPETSTGGDLPENKNVVLAMTSYDMKNLGNAFHLIITPETPTVQYIVVLGFDAYPSISLPQYYEQLRVVPEQLSEATTLDDYVAFFDNLCVGGFDGELKIGLLQVPHDKVNVYTNTSYIEPVAVSNFTVNYTTTPFTSGCFYQEDGGADGWMYDGVVVSPESTMDDTVCETTHFSSFGSGFAVAPNPIDFSYVFANFDFLTNPTLFSTEIVIFVLFVAAVVWARRADLKDKEKLGVTPLPDNEPEDKYLYEVVVYTGMRKNAGTDSKVQMILSGELDESDVRVFRDPNRKVFRRGAADSFLMAVPRPLGALNYMRIWHDNSGKGKYQGWYLKHVLVHDLQTRNKYYFIADKWFAVEEDDGQVDRLLPVATKETLSEFKQVFEQSTRKNMGDGHLWFSVVARPAQSRFTRVQRVGSCLCLLMTSMLANAMWYERTPERANSAFNIGPFAFTPEQIYVGIMANLIVFPVNFIIVTLFRKARPRKKRQSRIQEALQKADKQRAKEGRRTRIDDELQPMVKDGYGNNQGIATISRPGSSISSEKRSSQGQGEEQPPYEDPYGMDELMDSIDRYDSDPYGTNRGPDPYGGPGVGDKEQGYNKFSENAKQFRRKKKEPFSLPWWFRWVGWGLLIITVLASTFFVTMYGISFKDSKCQKWVTSLLISFITSIFLTQPIKVVLVALFLSMIFKKPEMEDEEGEEDEEDHGLQADEVWLHEIEQMEMYGTAKVRKIAYKPPDNKALLAAREYRIKELKMYGIIREIIFYAIFLYLLLVVSYGFRDPMAPTFRFHLHREFGDQGLHQINTFNDSFAKIAKTDQFWSWLRNTLIPGIRADNWYNSLPPVGQRGMVGDRVSRMMGYATVRQLRIEKRLCEPVAKMEGIVDECNKKYSFFDEDTEDYGPRWNPNDTASNVYEYKYRTGSELDGFPYWGTHNVYSGGGYVFKLQGSAKMMQARAIQLEKEGWINEYTRAIFVEFTVYNPGANLFGIVTYLGESLESAGIFPSFRIEPINLLNHYTSAALFTIFCEITYACFIIFFIVKEIRSLRLMGARNYFKRFWTWIELLVIGISIGTIVIYFYRFIMTRKLLKRFKETHGNGYMKFQYVAYWNELLMYMVGWLVFLSTIKFLRLLRFNKKMGLLAATLKHACYSLIMFGIMFFVIFMAFVQFFYYLYFINLNDFRTIVHAAETCLQMILGRFNFFAMKDANSVLGPMFFFIYVVSVGYILINMFITILNESFAAVRSDINKQRNDYEMVEFITEKFKVWLTLGKYKGVKPESASSGMQSTTPVEQLDEMNSEQDGSSAASPMKPAFEMQIDNFPEKVDRLVNCISKVYFDAERFDRVFEKAKQGNKQGMKNMMKDPSMKDAMRRHRLAQAMMSRSGYPGAQLPPRGQQPGTSGGNQTSLTPTDKGPLCKNGYGY